MKGKRLLVISSVCIALVLSVLVFMGGGTTSAGPVAPIELKFYTHFPPASPSIGLSLKPWARKVEEATGGKVKLTLYTGSTLMSARDVWQGTKRGLADISLGFQGFYPGQFPLIESVSLPFMDITSAAQGTKVLNALYDEFPEIRAQYRGVKMLFLTTEDPYLLWTVKKPVRTLEDFKGMKLRVSGGPPTEMAKAMGATPVNIVTGEMYEALDKGLVEGAPMSSDLCGALNFWEITNYVTDAPLYTTIFWWIMNQDTWDRLSPDIQEAIMSVSEQTGAAIVAAGKDKGMEVLQARIKKGGRDMEWIHVPESEVERWRQRCKGVWTQWVADMEAKGLPGQAVLDATLRLVEKYK